MRCSNPWCGNQAVDGCQSFVSSAPTCEKHDWRQVGKVLGLSVMTAEEGAEKIETMNRELAALSPINPNEPNVVMDSVSKHWE